MKKLGWIGVICALLWGCSEQDILEPTKLEPIQTEFSIVAALENRYEDRQESLSRRRALSGQEKFLAVSDTEGHLALYQRATLKREWKIQYFKPFEARGLIVDHFYYGATLEGHAIAIDLSDGSIVWEKPLMSAIEAEPAYQEGRLIYHLHDGRLMAFDARTGEPLWTVQHSVPNLSLIRDAGPLVDSGRIYAGFANGHMQALDLQTGQVIWDKPIVLPSENSARPSILTIMGPLVLDQKIIYTASFYDRVVALNAEDGTVLWDHPISTSLPVFLAPGMLIAVNADHQIYALNRSTGEVLWTQKGLIGRHITAAVATRSGVWVADGLGYLHVLALSDGHFIARYPLKGGRVNAEPFVYDDTVYLLAEDGRMQALVMRPL